MKDQVYLGGNSDYGEGDMLNIISVLYYFLGDRNVCGGM